MAEVNKTKKSKTKKPAKVLDKNINLDSDELLEQILNKKRNKVQKSITPRRKNTGTSTNNKKRTPKKDEISSDDIYEQIKAKRNSKKKRNIEKTNNIEKEELDNIVEEITKEDQKADKSNNDKVRDDLIITREIRFDDLSSNLKSKKTLKDLKDAIEQFDKLDDSNTNTEKLVDDIDLLPSVKYSNYKLKKLLFITRIILLVIIFILGIYLGFSNVKISNEMKMEEQRLLEEQRKREEEEKRLLSLYDDCLNRKITDADKTEDIIVATDNLKKYLKDNYYASVSYEDINKGYSFSYNDDKVYYAASTIKSLAALYIYKNASEGKINLDDTVTYTSRFKVSYSDGVKKHKIGSKIPLRTLVKYAIIYSDNSAHQMLVSYIGRSKLKEFGKSLGAKNTLVGGDNFGSISSNDGLIYMKAINEFIENNEVLGNELKSYFVESIQKEIAVNNLTVANKFGLYGSNYHNMAIVYDESPYIVAIMTLEGAKDEEKIVNDISKKVYELHTLYKTNRENICKIEIYGNKKSTNS